MSEVTFELNAPEKERLSELGRHLQEHLSALTVRWERALDELLAEAGQAASKGLRQESVAAAYAMIWTLAEGRPAEGWEEGHKYGAAMATQNLSHTILSEWLATLRQSLLTTLAQVYADDPHLDQVIVAFSKFFAFYMLRVTESFSSRQQGLLLEQQQALRRAYEEAQRRVVELEVLNEVGQAISSTIDLNNLLELIYQQTSRLMDTTTFFIALCDWERQELDFRILFEEGQRQTPVAQAMTEGLSGHIARTGEPLLLPHGATEFLQEQGIQRVGQPAQSWLGVPMLAQERVIGVIAVQSYTQDGAYDEGHLRVLSMIAAQAAIAVENARLFHEAQQRAEELETIYQTGAAAGSRLSVAEIIQSIYEQAGVVMDTAAFYVALYNRETDEITADLIYDRGQRMPPYRAKKSEQGGMTGWILDHGGTLLIRDWEEEATAEMRQVAVDMAEDPVRSWLSVPLVVRGEVTGLITAQSYQIGAFDEHDRHILEMIAHQSAAAIESARLYDEAQQRWRELETLLEVNRSLGALLDPHELLPSVLQAAIRTIPAAEKGSVFLLDPRTEELVIRAQVGYPPEVVDQVRLRPDEGFAGWVFQNQRGDVVADPSKDPRFKDAQASWVIRSMMAAPLIGRAGAIGVISLDNCNQPGAFTAADLRLLDGLAQQVAVAIDNARLLSETRRRLEEVEVLNEIGRAISSTMELSSLVELIYQQTSRLMDTTNVFMALYQRETDEVSFPLAVEDGQRVRWQARQAGSGLTEYVLRTGKPLLIRRDLDDELAALGVAAIGRSASSWLGVPILARDEPLGVIAVQSYIQTESYDEGHLRVLSTIASQAAVALENARLYQEARRRVEEMEALYRIGAASGSRLGLEEILQSIYEQASVVMDTSAFFVALYDRERDEIAFELDYELGERAEPTRRRKSDQGGLTGWLLEHGQPVLIRNWEQEAPEELRQVAVQVGEMPRSWLGVPMMMRGEAMGAIAAQSYQAEAFDEHDLQVLEMIAHQAGPAIESARLYQEAQRRVAQLTALQQVGLKLAAATGLSEVLDTIAESAIELLQANDVLIFLYDAAEQSFTLGTGVRDTGERGIFAPMPRKDGLTAAVAQSGQMQVIEDAATHPLYADMPAQARGLKSIVSAPLLRSGQVLGVLNVSYYTAHHFAPDELRLLQALADQAAVAVGNAHLFRQMQAIMQELQDTAATQSELLNLVQELATPVVPILSGVLLMPLVGSIDSQRGRQVLDRLLEEVERQSARIVLVDITGVPVVDTAVAQILLQTVQATQLLGGEAVLVGIRPEVAQTLISLGVDLSGITTRSDLQGGVAYAMRRISRQRS